MPYTNYLLNISIWPAIPHMREFPGTKPLLRAPVPIVCPVSLSVKQMPGSTSDSMTARERIRAPCRNLRALMALANGWGKFAEARTADATASLVIQLHATKTQMEVQYLFLNLGGALDVQRCYPGQLRR